MTRIAISGCSIIDLPLTQVLDGALLTVAAWYDVDPIQS
jgi:uncharacterized protein YceK